MPGLREGPDRQRVRGWVGVSGSGPRSPRTHDSSLACSGGTLLRGRVPSVVLQPQERSCGCRSTDGGLSGAKILRSRPDPVATAEPLDPQRTNAESCVHPSANPQPETPDQRRCRPPGRGPFGDQIQREPRQRTSRTRSPAAAHQHDETPRRSARAGPDPPRQRTGKVATTGNLQATLRAQGAGRSDVRRTARGCWTPRDATGRRGPHGRAGRRRPRRSAGRRCWPPAASAACRSGR